VHHSRESDAERRPIEEQRNVKAAVLVGDSACQGLVSLSFYDSKPVYFVSNACEKIYWKKKVVNYGTRTKARKLKHHFID